MPTYEYQCSQCGNKLEAFQKITDSPLKLCPRCGHESLHRGPGGGIGLAFKGTGFYKTDYTDNRPIETTPNESTKPQCCPCGKSKGSCNT